MFIFIKKFKFQIFVIFFNIYFIIFWIFNLDYSFMFQKVKKRNILFFMQSHIHSFFLFLFTKGFHCSKEISSLSTFRTNRKFDSNDSTKAQSCLTSMILRSFISTRCIVCVEREVFPR